MTDIASMIFWVIVVLSALVFFHELGHFLAAKLTGIRVDRFSIGFPPRLFGKKIGETDYCIQLVPLGGYCKMAGMVDESLDTESIKGEPWEFNSKPIPVRMLVLFSGPLMNFIVAIILLAVLSFVVGVRDYENSPTIGNVTSGLPAEQAGLLPGDVVLAIDDTPAESWDRMSEVIRANPEKTVTIKFRRDTEILERRITIAKQDNPAAGEQKEIGVLGIERIYHDRKLGVFGSVKQGVIQTSFLTYEIARAVKSLVFGKESIKSLGGPIMIAKLTDDFRKTGILAFISFVAFLSLNLGFMNLLPVPVLDGGHLLILLIEGIVRKQLPLKAKMITQQIGMALLLFLIVFIIYNDIVRIASNPG